LRNVDAIRVAGSDHHGKRRRKLLWSSTHSTKDVMKCTRRIKDGDHRVSRHRARDKKAFAIASYAWWPDTLERNAPVERCERYSPLEVNYAGTAAHLVRNVDHSLSEHRRRNRKWGNRNEGKRQPLAPTAIAG
jgi:hypothetical protein